MLTAISDVKCVRLPWDTIGNQLKEKNTCFLSLDLPWKEDLISIEWRCSHGVLIKKFIILTLLCQLFFVSRPLTRILSSTQPLSLQFLQGQVAHSQSPTQQSQSGRHPWLQVYAAESNKQDAFWFEGEIFNDFYWLAVWQPLSVTTSTATDCGLFVEVKEEVSWTRNSWGYTRAWPWLHSMAAFQQ